MKIIIGADLVPTQSNFELFQSGEAASLVGEKLSTLLKEADFRIFNLEVPLVDTETPIDKCGPNLITPSATVNGYKTLNVDLLTLANNHIMDQGKQGLDSTLKVLDENAIFHLGAGTCLNEAKEPFVFEIADKKIGVYACAEHEFSIAGEALAGANPFDPLESFDDVGDLKKRCDYVIVLYHGGKEHYRYPSLYLQKVCRKFVDKGADLIVCQHSHCVGCKEEYAGGTIVYGQGNFLFDRNDNEYWNTSVLVCLNEKFEVEFIPLQKNGNTVRLAEGEDGERILSGLEKRSAEIKQAGFIEESYKNFAQSMITHYLSSVSGARGFFFRAMNKLTGGRWAKSFIKRKYKKATRLAIRNYVECEADRELFLKGLEI